jgi:hypothetical protein
MNLQTVAFFYDKCSFLQFWILFSAFSIGGLSQNVRRIPIFKKDKRNTSFSGKMNVPTAKNRNSEYQTAIRNVKRRNTEPVHPRQEKRIAKRHKRNSSAPGRNKHKIVLSIL